MLISVLQSDISARDFMLPVGFILCSVNINIRGNDLPVIKLQ